jgi:phosphoribosylamine-glycine ligase
MIVGAEIKARRDAEAAIELARAARGAALVEALEAVATGTDTPVEERTRAAARVVKVLVQQGFVHEPEAEDAVEALVTSGLMESAIVQAAIAEAEDMVDE